jgi:transposase InsO family protein
MTVPRSGYYRYIRIKEQYKDSAIEAQLELEIKTLHKQTRASYGSRRMSQKLKIKGFAIGRYKARKLMLRYGLECKQRRRYTITTQSDHNLPLAENRLNRNFKTQMPNQVWVADITYLWTQEGWLYLAAIVDLFSRRVVGWAIADHMRSELIESAFSMAIGRRQPISQNLMHHSDRGCQYASCFYQNILKKFGVTVSMNRRANCWDNAVMERFFGSLKSERTDGINYVTREQAKNDVIDYIEMFYNSSRLHSSLNYQSPMEFEKKYLAFP